MVRKSITCISLLFIGCGISYFCFDKTYSVIDSKNNELLIGKYFKREIKNNNNEIDIKNNNVSKEEYIAVLQIPKINFKRGLYKENSPENKLSKNIIFLDSSDMPNKDNSKVIIVGHSGAPSNAYFKNLYKLNFKDKLILYYDNYKYIYEVSDIYEIKKTGNLALESNKGVKTLTLVTCKGLDKQLVIVSTLTKEEKLI